MANEKKYGCGPLLLLGLLFAACYLIGQFFKEYRPAPRSPPPAQSQNAAADAGRPGQSKLTAEEVDESVRLMTELKIIARVSPELNTAYVFPAAWENMNVDNKTTTAYVLALYCGRHKGTGLNWVVIKDYRSGKDLMKGSVKYQSQKSSRDPSTSRGVR